MTDLGLQRGIVRIVDHQPGWIALAADAISDLKAASALIIAAEHVGSTSIPGLPAKPILDVALGLVDETAAPTLAPHLSVLGYIYRGDKGEQGGHLFVREIAPEVRSIHVHAVRHGGQQWRHYLLFREALRSDAQLRDAYATLKQQLGDEFEQDRAAYTNAKQAFIKSVLKSA